MVRAVRLRVVLGVFAVLAVLTVTGVYLAVHSISAKLPQIVSQGCTVTGEVAGQVNRVSLEPEQLGNAATIAAVGLTRGLPERAVVVALATAMQESKLYNLDGGDRDSVGLFQQRPSQGWGTPDQIADPRYAAAKFYAALVKVSGWQDLRVADAAQKVQKSAYGNAYQRWADEAQILADAFTGSSAGTVGCVVTDLPPQRGTAATEALAQGVELDWGQVDTATDDALPGVVLTVDAARTGWQLAHWLVAQSAARGVKRVQFGDRQWTAKTGTWGHAAPATVAAAGDRVIAEVYPDQP